MMNQKRSCLRRSSNVKKKKWCAANRFLIINHLNKTRWCTIKFILFYLFVCICACFRYHQLFNGQQGFNVVSVDNNLHAFGIKSDLFIICVQLHGGGWVKTRALRRPGFIMFFPSLKHFLYDKTTNIEIFIRNNGTFLPINCWKMNVSCI